MASAQIFYSFILLNFLKGTSYIFIIFMLKTWRTLFWVLLPSELLSSHNNNNKNKILMLLIITSSFLKQQTTDEKGYVQEVENLEDRYPMGKTMVSRRMFAGDNCTSHHAKNGLMHGYWLAFRAVL
jgi:hypothetical protein